MLNNPYKAGPVAGAAPYGSHPGYGWGTTGNQYTGGMSQQSGYGGIGQQGGQPGYGPYPPPVPSGSYIPSGQGQGQGQPGIPGGQGQGQGQPGTPGQMPLEQSYIENILRLNLGKIATIYMTFENNSQWNAKIFKGRLETAGRDHIIISDPQTGMRYLLLMVNLDYVTFDEQLNYSYPYGNIPTSR